MTSRTAQTTYTHGIEAYKAASYETAVELFTHAIALDRSNPKYYDARASAYDRLNELQLALIDARTVVKLAPTVSKGYLRAARLLKQATKFANAEKVVLQGLAIVSKHDTKGISELERERDLLETLRIKAEFRPFSSLPLEIVVEILALATPAPPSSRYTNQEIPRARAPRASRLVTLMRVCRSWFRIVTGSPRFWHTLALDGVIHARTAEKKTRIYLERALGLGGGEGPQRRRGHDNAVRHDELDGATTTARGVQRIVLTAAQDLAAPVLSSILDHVRAAGVAPTVREVVLSFVDGSRTTASNEREAQIATELLVFLHQSSRTSLTALSVCTAGRCYPAFDLTNMYLAFPNLEAFKIWGSTTSTFVSNLRAPFLRSDPAPAASDRAEGVGDETPPTPTNARALAVTGTVLVADSVCRAASFPRLESLELDTIGGHVVWDLLSAPNLQKCHCVVYGEAATAVDLAVPDLAASWHRVEDLRLGGAKLLAARFLDHARQLGLAFAHLVNLDLSFTSLASRHLALFDSRDGAPQLRTLMLASTTTGPTETALELPHLGALVALDVSHTLWTTDATVRSLVNKCPRLEKLAIVGNAFVTGRPIMELVLARKRQPPRRSDDDDDKEDGRAREGGDGGGGGGGSEETGPARFSEMTELKLEGCDKLETAAVDWLRKNTRPGVVKFQFLDPADRRKGRWDRGI